MAHKKGRHVKVHAHHHQSHGYSHQHHQGRVVHPDMTSYIDGHGNQDPLAHSSHHAMNKEHGTHAGLSPEGCYEMGEDGPGGAIGSNAEDYD